MKKIAVITGTRAEYGIFKSRKLKKALDGCKKYVIEDKSEIRRMR